MTTRFLLRLARRVDARPGKIAVAFPLAAMIERPRTRKPWLAVKDKE